MNGAYPVEPSRSKKNFARQTVDVRGVRGLCMAFRTRLRLSACASRVTIRPVNTQQKARRAFHSAHGRSSFRRNHWWSRVSDRSRAHRRRSLAGIHRTGSRRANRAHAVLRRDAKRGSLQPPKLADARTSAGIRGHEQDHAVSVSPVSVTSTVVMPLRGGGCAVRSAVDGVAQSGFRCCRVVRRAGACHHAGQWTP